MRPRTKLERSLDQANARVRSLLRNGAHPDLVHEAREQASSARAALYRHRRRMEGRG